MNFLEELVAEWYEFNNYFIKKNVKIEPLKKGGYKGEMDVIAYNPINKELIHIEPTSDAESWDKRKVNLIKKFKTAQNHYSRLFQFKYKNVKKIVIAGFGKKHPKEISLGKEIEIKSIPEFTIEIINALKKYPISKAIPEKYPLLRTIQTTFQTIQKYEKNKTN